MSNPWALGANSGALYWKQNGRTYRVLELQVGVEAANAAMDANEHLAAIAQLGELVVLVDKNDRGVSLREAQS